MFRRTIEATSDAFVGIDSSGRVTDWNAAAESSLRLGEPRGIRHAAREVDVPEEYVESYSEILLQALAAGSRTAQSDAP